MLLSNQRQFLFVHIAKTGGSSIRSALSNGRWHDPLQAATAVCNRLSHLTGHRIAAKLPRHAAAIAAKELLKPGHYERLFKFTIVRNPWDRLVSAYHHFQREQDGLLRGQKVSSFRDFAKWIVDDAAGYRGDKHVFVAAVRRPQIEHIIDLSGACIVDFIGRYEQLDEDFRQISSRIGLPVRELPHKRRSHNKGDYRRHFDDSTCEVAEKFYREDIAAFNYQFSEATQDWGQPVAQAALALKRG